MITQGRLHLIEDTLTIGQPHVISKQSTGDSDREDVQIHHEKGMLERQRGKHRKRYTTFPHPSITFTNEDLRGLYLPHDDALVISTTITNFNIQKILIDNESSAYILFVSTFNKMRNGRDRLYPFHSPLVVFRRGSIHPL